MNRFGTVRWLIAGLVLSQSCSGASEQSPPVRKGLLQPVEIIRDRWGVNHIYAKNEHDLFYAQGYSAAKDRLFQFELWRRQATGTVAELLGPQELKRDMGTRLFRFRGNIQQELLHYHPHGPQIVGAFVEGINAYVTEMLQTPEKLPFEFQVLNMKPGLWTPEVVISRHQGLLGNVRDELKYGRLVSLIGADKLRELNWFHPASSPAQPDLTLHVNGDELFQPILELYEAFRLPLRFQGRLAKADEDEAALMPSGTLTPGPSPVLGGPPSREGLGVRVPDGMRAAGLRPKNSTPVPTTGLFRGINPSVATLCWPTTRTGRNRRHHCGTGRTSVRRAGTLSGRGSRRCPVFPSATTTTARGD